VRCGERHRGKRWRRWLTDVGSDGGGRASIVGRQFYTRAQNGVRLHLPVQPMGLRRRPTQQMTGGPPLHSSFQILNKPEICIPPKKNR
jgi:hypothetical protein